MNTQNWKIFSREGSNINIFTDSYLNLSALSTAQNATGFSGYAITDPSGLIIGSKIVNSGWEYDPLTQIQLEYSFGESPGVLTSSEVSIGWIDVSIFNPYPNNSKGIGNLEIDISTVFSYPSYSFTSAIFLKPVSQGLIETEHLSIMEEVSTGIFGSPHDETNPILIFRMDHDGDTEIKLFEINDADQTVVWADEIRTDISTYIINSALMINVGFRAEDEGVFERKLRVYHLVGEREYLIGEILFNAESIGPDERFDTLITNFGLPSPKSTPTLFKEADINEELPDWQLLNYKAKHIILEHDKIMPYIGSYKALINAIKWLGYDDIGVKEWFRNVKDNTKLALTVPFESKDRTKTILSFSAEERAHLKKLNQLSLVYCITRETGEIDEWGNPLTEECYNYNLNEILIKLYALKQWLERWIIGVNARITDITGEGIYFERFRNFIYSTQKFQTDANLTQSLTPKTILPNSELAMGDSSILLTLKEIEETPITKLTCKIKDIAGYAWDPSNGAFNIEDASLLSYYDPSTIFIGNPFQYALLGLSDIQWRGSVEKTEAGVLTSNLVTSPLFIYKNEIRFWNIIDTHSKFYDISTNLNIVLEKATLRDPSNDIWNESTAYRIYPDPSGSGAYFMESSSGLDLYKVYGYINLVPDTGSELVYEFDSNYRFPLLSFKNYKFTDSSNNIVSLNKKYFLDIEDGKIVMDSSTTGSKGEIISIENYINWNYDTSLNEQKITLNVVYNSPRMPISVYDPSLYWYYTVELGGQDPSLARVEDNGIYQLNVNHIGDYTLEVFGWDGQNNIFFNNIKTPYNVWTRFPKIISYLDTSFGSDLGVAINTYLSPDDISALISKNLYPIFDRQIPIEGLSLEMDELGNPYLKVPSISYFIDLPPAGSIARFYNLTERCTSINSSEVVVDPDYQEFFDGDSVKLVLWDKGSLYFISESSSNITGILGNTLTLDYIPAEYLGKEASTEIYLINTTERTSYNPVNDLVNNTLNIDISTYSFKEGQLVAIIINDVCTGYNWGAAFRVLDVSVLPNPYGYTHTMEGNMPDVVINNPTRYSLTSKHSFTEYSDFTVEINKLFEVGNNFRIYPKDPFFEKYYLDNTFLFVNVLFDHEYVIDQWYDPSTDSLIGSNSYYPFTKAVSVDVSTLVIFSAYFDASDYMLDQKNIWTVNNTKTKEMIFRVYNDNVPFIFNESGTYDLLLESYDKFGNLRSKSWEGLLTVV